MKSNFRRYNEDGVPAAVSRKGVKSKNARRLDQAEVMWQKLPGGRTSHSPGSGVYVERHRAGVQFTVTSKGAISKMDYALLFETFIQVC